MRLRIGTRIAAGFGVVVLLMIGLGIVAYSSAETLSGLTTKLYRHPFAVTNALAAADTQIVAMHRSVKDVALAKDATAIDRATADIDRREKLVHEQFAILRERFLGDRSQLEAAVKAFAAWKPFRDETIRLTRAGQHDEAAARSVTAGATLLADIDKTLQPMIAFSQALAIEFMAGAEATAARTQMLILAALAAALALGGAAAILTTRTIVRPVTRLKATMLTLADGDLGVEVPATGRSDEVGEMAKAVEVFKANGLEQRRLQAEQKEREARAAEIRKAEMNRLADNFEAAVGAIVGTVSSAASQLEAAAGTLTGTAGATQHLSIAVASASEEASANVQSVASASEELTGSVNEIARQVQESSRIAGDAVNQAATTDARIAELSQAAARIGDVVKLITAIAEQTNLLALNATIEAARAGEAGRGFAVVAAEVKSLANQTAKATEDIGAQIGAMQAATQESVTAIKQIGGTIGRISEIANTIAAAVEEQGAATGEIARNVQQAAHGTTEVAAKIGEVHRGAAETGTASSQVLSSAQALASEGRHLREEVDRFLATVRAA